MATRRHLDRAPIQEALIDIRFEPPVVSTLVDSMAGEFAKPNGTVHDLWETTFELRGGSEPQTTQTTQTGVRAGKRIDFGKNVVQLRTTGFTFSRLAPYQDWEAMSLDAANLWQRYLKAAGEVAIIRLAVRYINVLNLQLPMGDFKEFLNSPPAVPEPLPQAVSSFMTRVVSVDQASNDHAAVTQVFEGLSPGSQEFKLILDIDVFHPCSFGGLDFTQISTVLARLRDLKNDVFFEYLTDKSLENC